MSISTTLVGTVQPSAGRSVETTSRHERRRLSNGVELWRDEEASCRFARTGRPEHACWALRSRTVPRAAGADEVASAIRGLAAPALSVAGSLAAVSGSAAVVLYRLGTIDKKLGEKFDSLDKKIDKQGKDLVDKIDKQGKDLVDKIDKQGKDLGERIDKQERSISTVSTDVRALGNDVANIKGRLAPWYPPTSWGPPPGAPMGPGRAAEEAAPGAEERPPT